MGQSGCSVRPPHKFQEFTATQIENPQENIGLNKNDSSSSTKHPVKETALIYVLINKTLQFNKRIDKDSFFMKKGFV
jgi:hypothetical protein